MKRYCYLLILVIFLVVSCGEEALEEDQADDQDISFEKYTLVIDSFIIGERTGRTVFKSNDETLLNDIIDDLENCRFPAKLRKELEEAIATLSLAGYYVVAPSDNAVVVRCGTPYSPNAGPYASWLIAEENMTSIENYLAASYEIWIFPDEENPDPSQIPRIRVNGIDLMGFALGCTIQNNSSSDLFMDDCSFWIMDRDENVVHKEYKLPNPKNLVKILPGGIAEVSIAVGGFSRQPKGQYKLVGRLMDEEKILEIPIEKGHFDEIGNFLWNW